MKFTNDANIERTSLKGYVIASFDELVDAFGAPDDGPDDRTGDKVTCCWRLQFEDGTVATIYDWKEDATPYHRYDWHIGGKSSEAIELVHQTLDKSRRLQEIVKSQFKKLDKKLGVRATTPPELLALFNTKLEKANG
jgi:hypothetical protein